MPPIPTEWWLRPLSRAALVGEQRAVVWNRLNLRPSAARRSAVGVKMGPPNADEAPKPVSSMRTTRTFGAPAGGRSSRTGGEVVVGVLAVEGGRSEARPSGVGRQPCR